MCVRLGEYEFGNGIGIRVKPGEALLGFVFLFSVPKYEVVTKESVTDADVTIHILVLTLYLHFPDKRLFIMWQVAVASERSCQYYRAWKCIQTKQMGLALLRCHAQQHMAQGGL